MRDRAKPARSSTRTDRVALPNKKAGIIQKDQNPPSLNLSKFVLRARQASADCIALRPGQKHVLRDKCVPSEIHL